MLRASCPLHVRSSSGAQPNERQQPACLSSRPAFPAAPVEGIWIVPTNCKLRTGPVPLRIPYDSVLVIRCFGDVGNVLSSPRSLDRALFPAEYRSLRPPCVPRWMCRAFYSSCVPLVRTGSWMPSEVRSRDVFVPSHPHVHVPAPCDDTSSRYVLETVEIAGEDRGSFIVPAFEPQKECAPCKTAHPSAVIVATCRFVLFGETLNVSTEKAQPNKR
jgi:hypothetical protein